jgi:hypothetical protein
MNANKPPSYNVVPFLNKNNFISPYDLENILEDLEDMNYLSEKGKEFRNKFWKLFILK